MTDIPVYHRSARQDWPTARWLFAGLDAEHRFDLDAAASPHNALCPRYLTEKDDALTVPWDARAAFCNPPYTRTNGGLDAWLANARVEAARDVTVVLLVPARTDDGWWVRHVLHADEVRFISGRLRFGNATEPAPFPSAVIVFRPPTRYAGPKGTTYTLRSLTRPVFSYLERTVLDPSLAVPGSNTPSNSDTDHSTCP